jgi:hypothetical protein
MAEIKTNRDLYLAISQLIEREKKSVRTLEEYLRALLGLAGRYRVETALPVAQFFALLDGAFTVEVGGFNPEWKSLYPDLHEESEGFEAWQATLIRQIVDLREMAEEGMLADPYRYLGIDSPRRRRWYNFDPYTFLECAMAGSYGGWQPDDETGRLYVPGPVLVLGEAGALESRNPEALEEPVFFLPEITWAEFCEFLLQGQYYE